MDFQIKKQNSYRSELTFLSLMTLLFGFLCLMLGYFILPVAAGFYAALLSIEKKDGRILSYVIPLIPLAINVFVNGFCSLEALGYVIVGAIIFYGFDRKKNKATTVFYATVALFALMIASFALLAFDQLGTFRLAAIGDFSEDLYQSGKAKIIMALTQYTDVDAEGFVFHLYTPSDAVEMYNSFILNLIPTIIVFSLIVVGLSMKLLSSRILRYDAKDERLVGWKFVTPPFIAYSYVVLFVLASLSSQGIVGVSIYFVSSVLMAIYFYIGAYATYEYISLKKNPRFALLVIIFATAAFYYFVPQIISLIGVFVNNAAYNKGQNQSD